MTITTPPETTAPPETPEGRALLDIEAGGPAVEAAGGLAVIVLTVIGLAGTAPTFMASIAGIIIGVALLAQGGTIAAAFSRMLQKISGGALGASEAGGGMTLEVLGGGAAVVLGILALIGENPMVLIAVLVLGAGATLMFSAGTMQRLNDLKVEGSAASEPARRVAHMAASSTVSAQILAGLTAVVLGILALVYHPAATAGAAPGSANTMLALVGLLVLGAAIALSGMAFTGKLTRMLSQG
jgi:hypothetical protein